MSFYYPPKPIVFFSKPLIYYPLVSLKSIGVESFYVIANPWSKELIEYVLSSSLLGPFRYEVEVLWRFWEENGSSLVVGLNRAFSEDDRVILTMGDHVFEPKIALKVVNALDRCPASIAADRRPKWVDLKEATKIRAEGSLAKKFGKNLSNYNYVDTGVFGFRDDSLDLIKEAYVRGATRVSEIMNYLAKKSRVCVVDVTGSNWIDIDTIDELVFTAPLVLKEISLL
jgi:choline kinase